LILPDLFKQITFASKGHGQVLLEKKYTDKAIKEKQGLNRCYLLIFLRSYPGITLLEYEHQK